MVAGFATDNQPVIAPVGAGSGKEGQASRRKLPCKRNPPRLVAPWAATKRNSGSVFCLLSALHSLCFEVVMVRAPVGITPMAMRSVSTSNCRWIRRLWRWGLPARGRCAALLTGDDAHSSVGRNGGAAGRNWGRPCRVTANFSRWALTITWMKSSGVDVDETPETIASLSCAVGLPALTGKIVDVPIAGNETLGNGPASCDNPNEVDATLVHSGACTAT